MGKIFESIKNFSLTYWYIIILCVIGLIVLISLFIAFIKREKGQVIYDKSDFVHKMLTKDNSVKFQLLMAAAIGLLAAFLALFFCKVVMPAMIVLYVFAGVIALRLYYKLDERFDRVEYNLKELHRYGFLRKPRIIAWADVHRVGVQGVHKNRKLIFEGKRKKIKVELSREGSYEFMVFCEKTLEGKNFEAIKIAKGRR